ncbi:hypothetical protein [Winogradskyella schleiferi]|uniref:hypothetical protein n=1 Tax=Winogradskyella schleiferi TaxID=2686078 RepID=UPI001E3AE7E0|nr:hypothetical protein [Winogradskyella schleiferi]
MVAIILAITPYLFSLYEGVPSTETWNTFLFSYDSKVWGNANLVMWILTGKAVPLLLLFLWFFTCRHWWYHALLVPIIMYIYQIFNLFNEDQNNLDESQIIYLLPIMAIVIPSIYLIRAKMFNKINNADKTLEEMEEEFMIKPKGLWSKVKQYF